MSELPTSTEMRRFFTQSADARDLVAPSVGATAMDAKLAEVLTPLWSAVRELVEWLVLHEPEGDVSVTATWHDRLVLIDVRDTGTDLPKPESTRADA